MDEETVPLPLKSARATHFKEARMQRLAEIAEDYTELIADLIATDGQARVYAIAREMGISHVSVLKSVKRLIRDGYLLREENLITLTPKGKELAAFSKRKHDVLSAFLSKLGVPEAIAASDVEGIEHHISPPTLAAIEKLLDQLKEAAI
jgi:DtxR family manganese transport transcriptional regulator